MKRLMTTPPPREGPPNGIPRTGIPAWIAWLPILIALMLQASPAGAVLIASGDGSGNTSPPADDPGFANVAIVNGLSGVYIGNGWILSAYHVGVGTVELDGSSYEVVPLSRTRLVGSDPNPPDLQLLRIVGDPGLPVTAIATTTPPIGSEVVLIGRGKGRGSPVTWSTHSGWNWDFPFTIRWGTNKVSDTGVVSLDTHGFTMDFDTLGSAPSTSHESQVAIGDSGGAVYWKSGGIWWLAGTLYLAYGYENQPSQTSLYGNMSGAADLSVYRDEILSIVAVPACDNGLDDDLDGLIDSAADPGCSDASDPSERSSSLACDDGLDNDEDGLIDHPADPECLSPLTPSEAAVLPLSSPLSILLAATLLLGIGLLHAPDPT